MGRPIENAHFRWLVSCLGGTQRDGSEHDCAVPEAFVTHRSCLICAAMLLIASAWSPLRAQQTGPQSAGDAKPAIVVTKVSTLNASVAAVDKAERLVTLRSDDGREQSIKCGPEVRNFDQIEVGDRVTAEYHEATAIFARKPQAAAGAAESGPGGVARSYGMAELAPLGAKPGGLITNVSELTATVDDIDYVKRQVVLLGPSGRPRMISVGDDVQNFESLRKGDEVVIRYTEAIAISVAK
jgi:hypothetical protein